MNTNRKETLILSSEDVQQVIRHMGPDDLMDSLIERLEITIKSFDSNWTNIPARKGFHYEKPESGLIEWMPLYNRGEHVMLKVVGYHPANPTQRALPTILSTLSAYDTDTGHLSVIVDGVLPTAMRTGAASAVASRVLANPQSKVLGILGCGAQAITQLHALSRVFDIEKVLIYDIAGDAVKSFSRRTTALNLQSEIQDASIERVVSESDILCTATSIEIGSGPLFDGIETKDHLHINAVGSDFPGKVEIPRSLLERSVVCPDFYEQAILEGECQQLDPAEIGPGLVDVVKDEFKFDEIKFSRSVFDSTGWALEDHVAMDLFLECAMQLELGQWIQIETVSNDSKSPFEFLESNSDTEVSKLLEAIPTSR